MHDASCTIIMHDVWSKEDNLKNEDNLENGDNLKTLVVLVNHTVLKDVFQNDVCLQIIMQ